MTTSSFCVGRTAAAQLACGRGPMCFFRGPFLGPFQGFFRAFFKACLRAFLNAFLRAVLGLLVKELYRAFFGPLRVDHCRSQPRSRLHAFFEPPLGQKRESVPPPSPPPAPPTYMCPGYLVARAASSATALLTLSIACWPVPGKHQVCFLSSQPMKRLDLSRSACEASCRKSYS